MGAKWGFPCTQNQLPWVHKVSEKRDLVLWYIFCCLFVCLNVSVCVIYCRCRPKNRTMVHFAFSLVKQSILSWFNYKHISLNSPIIYVEIWHLVNWISPNQIIIDSYIRTVKHVQYICIHTHTHTLNQLVCVLIKGSLDLNIHFYQNCTSQIKNERFKYGYCYYWDSTHRQTHFTLRQTWKSKNSTEEPSSVPVSAHMSV